MTTTLLRSPSYLSPPRHHVGHPTLPRNGHHPDDADLLDHLLHHIGPAVLPGKENPSSHYSDCRKLDWYRRQSPCCCPADLIRAHINERVARSHPLPQEYKQLSPFRGGMFALGVGVSIPINMTTWLLPANLLSGLLLTGHLLSLMKEGCH